jgi:hypothetical protein
MADSLGIIAVGLCQIAPHTGRTFLGFSSFLKNYGNR